jgi:hypothetical protein
VKRSPDSGVAAVERQKRSAHARMILARTFQRREDIDFDWYLGKADAALYNLNDAGWRVVRLGPNGEVAEEWTL